MTRFSAHLSLEEMACSDGTPYPAEWLETRGRVLARTFERIRSRLGEITGEVRPIHVESVYRTPAWNAGVGGAPASLHLQGLAIDLHPPSGVTVEQLHKAATDTIAASRGGIFIYSWGIHVDRRDYLGKRPQRADFRK